MEPATRDGADLGSVVAPTDRGSQYNSIRYTERLDQAGIAASARWHFRGTKARRQWATNADGVSKRPSAVWPDRRP